MERPRTATSGGQSGGGWAAVVEDDRDWRDLVDEVNEAKELQERQLGGRRRRVSFEVEWGVAWVEEHRNSRFPIFS